MYRDVKRFFLLHEKFTLFLLVLFFTCIRFPGVNLPLHQDEYKWPMIVNPANESGTSIPHPPLSQFIYRTAGYIVGYDVDFRYVPLFFGTLNLLLLYYLLRFRFDRRVALIGSIIWIFSYFSVLASLMVDTDGEIMPFFFLLAAISYYKFPEASGTKKYYWLLLLAVSCVLGFLVKVSFFLAISAVGADFLWSRRKKITRRQMAKYSGVFAGTILGLIALLYFVTLIFPFFDLAGSLVYWKHFFVADRGWFQTAIQCVKALLYSSPLLVIVPFFARKEYFGKIRLFVFFLIFSLIFYILLFDFSIGALDRYLQLLILPLTILASVTIRNVFQEENQAGRNRSKEFFLLGGIIALILVLLQSMPHYVPPLHPKAEWIGRILSFRWNFLYPFSGGSGPLGFYISFIFMAVAWLVSIGAVAYSLLAKQKKLLMLAFLLPIAFTYNLVFIEEYLIGHWNGSAPSLLRDAVEYIKSDPEIKMVTVYNDNGGNEIQEIGKYRKRLYVDPKFDINEKIRSLNQYKEHYFVLDVPRIDPASVYQRFFHSCVVGYKHSDKSMSAIIYDCRNAPDIKI